jgi:hypothetical protein
MKGFAGKHHTEESKRKISASKAGKRHSEQTKLKIKANWKNQYAQSSLDGQD